ncbi:phytanoyl-CoA dioxygenase family protein [Anatilimnocola sp. NA78]|uniref:phytanoyl-CoA dioxygenase family protein n=1 Tax=Anatilimnocola sp. NA78 TaxID=3415683 RepID=UPI003CE52BFF
MQPSQVFCDEVSRNGFTIIPRAIAPQHADELAVLFTASLAQGSEQGSPLESRGTVYAARNPLDLLPNVAQLWQHGPLAEFLPAILGPNFGLVRGLFFDKPPGRSWWLPWHKDLTIAVQDNSLPSQQFTRPTFKANVPHVIAPVELLQSMLTIRLHLDDVTGENGPLRVIPGSHLTGKEIAAGNVEPITILANRGDALAMRPLVSHSSGESSPETKLHRRILHLEFAASPQLADGYQWQRFIPGCSEGNNRTS